MNTEKDKRLREARGRRLRQVRRTLQLSQEDLAEELGLSQSGVSHIENGRHGLSISLVSVLTEKFGMSAQWFVTGEGLPFVERDDPALISADPQPASAGQIDLDNGSLAETLRTHVFPEVSESVELRAFRVPAGVLASVTEGSEWIIARRVQEFEDLGSGGLAILVDGSEVYFRKLDEVDSNGGSPGKIGGEFTRARSKVAELWLMIARISREIGYVERLEQRVDSLEEAVSRLARIIADKKIDV